jgi:hypothetical protein
MPDDDTPTGLLAVPGQWRITDYSVVRKDRLAPAGERWKVVRWQEGHPITVADRLPNSDAAWEVAKENGPNPRMFHECVYCGNSFPEEFVVRNSVWQEAGLGPGRIHLECLEEQLGRPLTLDDFNLNLPANEVLAFGIALGRDMERG